MARSSTRHAREIYCVDSAGETPDMHGEIGNDPCPGGYRPEGVVTDASTVTVTFQTCVSITGATGIEYRVNGGAWTEVAGVVEVSTTEYQFDVTPTAILAGDTVEWRYIGGSDTIQTCDTPAEDVGDLGPILVNNPLVLAGDFVLLETGGADIVLVEEDTDGSAGVQTEEAP